MRPRLRKLTLTAHVTFSVGWLGAVAAYLAPATAGLASEDTQTIRSAYVAMDLIGRFVIVPCSLAALLTGLVQSLGTEWGVIPALLDLGEIPVHRRCHHCLAAASAHHEPCGGNDIVRCRFRRAAAPTPGSCCGRSAGVAYRNSAVGLQTVGQDPLPGGATFLSLQAGFSVISSQWSNNVKRNPSRPQQESNRPVCRWHADPERDVDNETGAPDKNRAEK